MNTAQSTMRSALYFHESAMRQLVEIRAIQATITYGEKRGMVAENIMVGDDEIGDRIHPKDMASQILSLLDKVPEEYRDSATIGVDPEDGACTWTLSYERPETDAELQNRINIVRDAEQRQEAEARAQYERLKKTFG